MIARTLVVIGLIAAFMWIPYLTGLIVLTKDAGIFLLWAVGFVIDAVILWIGGYIFSN